jgi:broad specificity phosphatase PhoE
VEVLFIRHAESLGNVEHIMQGQHDFALSERGLVQAEHLSQRLQRELGHNLSLPSRFYCSPLSRTRQTLAPTLKAFSEIACVYDERLLEVDSGIFSGMTWKQAGEKHPEVQQQFAVSRDWGSVPGGESKVALWKRAEGFLQALVSQESENAFIVVMSHGGFIRSCLSYLACVPSEAPVFVCIDNTALSLAGIKNQRHYIRYINDTQHLQTHDFQRDFIPH